MDINQKIVFRDFREFFLWEILDKMFEHGTNLQYGTKPQSYICGTVAIEASKKFEDFFKYVFKGYNHDETVCMDVIISFLKTCHHIAIERVNELQKSNDPKDWFRSEEYGNVRNAMWFAYKKYEEYNNEVSS